MSTETLAYARLKKRADRHLLQSTMGFGTEKGMSRSQQGAEWLAPPIAPRGVSAIPGWRDYHPGATQTGRLVRDQYQAFVEGEAGGGLSALERLAAALRVAVLNKHEELTDHYRSRLRALDASARVIAAVERPEGNAHLSPRLVAILRYARLLANGPRAIRCTHVRVLQDQGLDIADIAALTRLVAFVNYQAGLLADLNLVEGA